MLKVGVCTPYDDQISIVKPQIVRIWHCLQILQVMGRDVSEADSEELLLPPQWADTTQRLLVVLGTFAPVASLVIFGHGCGRDTMISFHELPAKNMEKS